MAWAEMTREQDAAGEFFAGFFASVGVVLGEDGRVTVGLFREAGACAPIALVKLDEDGRVAALTLSDYGKDIDRAVNAYRAYLAEVGIR